MKECIYKERQTPIIPECSDNGQASFYVPNYYSQKNPIKDKSLYVCNAHMKFHQQINPLSGLNFKPIN